MFLTMKVAFRNISRQKKRSFLLAGAIAFGMMIITLMNALTGGAVINIRDNFSHALGGHVFITGREWTDAGQMIMKIRPDANLIVSEENRPDCSLYQAQSGYAVVDFRFAADLAYAVWSRFRRGRTLGK